MMYFKCAFALVLVCAFHFAVADEDPNRFLNFLLRNVWNNTGLPLSYRVPDGYWDTVPPVHDNPAPQYVALCGREVTVAELDAYTAQTEQFLTSFGINLYDAAVREIALTLLNQASVAQKYESNVLIAGKTLQFGNIRASAPCVGITYRGQCNDTLQVGACGFCYGGNNGQNDKGVTENDDHAYFFRLISDVYAYGGTVDARCPEKKIAWAWNDWRPVVGENAWANFIGPLQVAYIQAKKNVNNIDDDSSAMQLATRLFPTIQTMQMPNGAIAYAPYNTYDAGNPALGGTASVENAASTLAGLRALLFVLDNKQNTRYKSLAPQVRAVADKLLQFIKTAYDPNLGYFLQGGTYLKSGWQWNRDSSSAFAVDCQTWVVSVVGASTIDSWFGAGTALKIWQTTKKIGGYGYNAQTGNVIGLGFSFNQQDQVFSGEWSFGGVNMLRSLAKAYPANAVALNNEANSIREAIDDHLTFHDNAINSDVINYANKRYKIPFGWWANPITSLASVSWAVMTDSNFNPFVMGGAY